MLRVHINEVSIIRQQCEFHISQISFPILIESFHFEILSHWPQCRHCLFNQGLCRAKTKLPFYWLPLSNGTQFEFFGTCLFFCNSENLMSSRRTTLPSVPCWPGYKALLLILLLMGSFKNIPAGQIFDFCCLLINTLSLSERTIELPSTSCWPGCTFKIVSAVQVFGIN